MDNSHDLAWYAVAVRDRWESIACDFLSTPHPTVPMPTFPTDFMVEPYIHTDTIEAHPKDEGGYEFVWQVKLVFG